MVVKREIPINSDSLQDELYIYPISSFLWKYLTAESGGENILKRAGLLISTRTLICHQILLKQSSVALWKVFKYRAFSGPVFIPNTGNYGPEKTPYLDTFHAVCPT